MITPRRRRALAAAIAATGIVAVAGSTAATARTPDLARDSSGALRAVIVQGADPASTAAAVRAVGGTVTMPLAIVRGVAARVPADAVARLEATAGIRAVTPDSRVTVMESAPTGPSESNSASPVLGEINAYRLWKEGNLGQGVRVALVDTGIAQTPDLAGRVVPVADPSGSGETVECVNFSGESTCHDSYGHGTFIAGLIAGDGVQSGYAYPGAAPRAELVSIKIAGRDGSADVSKVLAAIQWTVSFKDTSNIKVLNLSLGTDSKVSYKTDPLNYAVERAWGEGIAVVVAASNRGPAAGTISKPADDPLVITVGAVDDRSTTGIGDDLVAGFTGRGPTATDKLAKPDVVAPGVRVASLRSPGSLIEEKAPGGGIDAVYRRASGTSMSAGVVSGAVALIRAANPTWSPDRVKFALMSTARRPSGADPAAVGAGIIDAYAAARTAPEGLANIGVEAVGDLRGTLEGSRGTVFTTGKPCLDIERMLDPECDRVKGNETAQGTWFTPGNYDDPWSGHSWYESQWVGHSWYTSEWYGHSWYTAPEGPLGKLGTLVPGSAFYGAWS